MQRWVEEYWLRMIHKERRQEEETYRSNERVSFFVSGSKYGADTEVDELDVTRFSQQDVCSFDVSMDDAVFV